MSNTNFITFSKPFMDAAKNVFETMVFSKLEPGKPQVKQDSVSKGDVSATIGINGTYMTDDSEERNFKGMLVISWPYETYFKVAAAMLMEETPYTEYSPEIADVGGEICNMIMGNAKRDLTEIGFKTAMAIPSIIEGKDHSIKYPPGTTTILIPIVSAHGDMYIELCFRTD